MADSWIKMRVTLPRCPQVVRLASAFDADKSPLPVRILSALGALHATWSLFDTHSADGELAGYSLEALDVAIGIPGWAAALVAVGWLAVTGSGIAIPEWEKHNGTSAKRRSQEADRKRNVRTRRGRTSAPNADAERTLSSSSSSSSSISLSEGETEREPRAATAPPEGSGSRALERQLSGRMDLRPEVAAALRDWAKHRDEQGKPLTATTIGKLVLAATRDPEALLKRLGVSTESGTTVLMDQGRNGKGYLTAHEKSQQGLTALEQHLREQFPDDFATPPQLTP